MSEATDEKDLDFAIAVFREGMHIDKEEVKNVTKCANVKVRCLACFGHLFVKRYLRVKINTQIFD